MGKPGFALACLGGLVALTRATLAAQDPGTVLNEVEIASGAGGFGGVLDDQDHFGHAVACTEDLDGDGRRELLVGSPGDDDGGLNRGAVWILFLDPSGSVRAQQKVSQTAGGFPATLRNSDNFGSALASLGDLDGDGTVEVAVGAALDDDGGLNRGAVWILSLDPAGNATGATKISQLQGGFGGSLHNGDRFGGALAALDDLDGDGIRELAVGAALDPDGGTARGAVWILFLDAHGAVKRHTKLSSTSGAFNGPLANNDHFGNSLALLGDLDHDGYSELAVGADQDDDGGLDVGAVWVLFLAPDGTVRTHSKLSGGAAPLLDLSDHFGTSLAAPGDVDGDGIPDLAVGAFSDDDGALNAGAVWIVFLAADGSMRGEQKISALAGGLTGPLASNDWLGSSLAALGDLDGDLMLDVVVGTENDDSGGFDRGAVRVLFLQSAPVTTTTLVVRNGLGINPILLSAREAPRLSTPWEVTIDCRGFNRGVLFHLAVDRPMPNGPVCGRVGQILVDWRRPQLLGIMTMHDGTEMHLVHQVPPYAGFLGLPFYSQALVLGRGGAKLTTALDGEFLPR